MMPNRFTGLMVRAQQPNTLPEWSTTGKGAGAGDDRARPTTDHRSGMGPRFRRYPTPNWRPGSAR